PRALWAPASPFTETTNASPSSPAVLIPKSSPDTHIKLAVDAERLPQSFVEICSYCGELVADAADGDDALRVRRIFLELLAQVGDVDVTGALVTHVLAVPEVLHDLAPAEHPFGLLRQKQQKLVLRGRQALRVARDGRLMAHRIELERPDS